MKKILCAVSFVLCLCQLQAQNITAAEYFFDSDPGAGNGTFISVGTAGTTVNFTANISTASLSTGFHTLAIRTKDATNMWSLFETRAFYISTATGDAAAITAAEYFIDADPGTGAGIPLNVGASGNTVNFTASIPTTSLSNGFHTVAIRTRDANGNWSLFETRAFYITASSTDAPQLVAAEYFIDTDPGTGSGTPISIGAAGNTINFTTLIPTTSLALGFHTLAIRTKDANNVWSLFENRAFYISSSTADVTAITSAEYFIDSDPGAGNGTSMSIGASGNTVNFTSLIPTGSLSNGFHVLAIRTRNSAGQWSLFETRAFYISTSAADMTIVSQAEYFIDSDPGIGNGSPLTVNVPGNTVAQTFLANVPVGTMPGQHLLAIRTRDANGNWGLFETAQFTVGGTLPLTWISFTGERVNASNRLKWVTENEINTSHFVVERSKNGVDFISVGRVNTLNGTHNNYQFDDVHPLGGANFYRLKQIDQNGEFKYSAIVRLNWSDGSDLTLKLYPNPASSVLTAEFAGREKDAFIQIYDVNGKLVQNSKMANQNILTISIINLANGKYWITISDGITKQTGSFIKD